MSVFIRIFVLAILVVSIASQPLKYDRVLLTEEDDPQAVCLDGSPGSHYIYKGDPDKVLVIFLGGGFCGQLTIAETIQSCYKRSKSSLGSSNFTQSTIEISQGIGSGSEQNVFKNWTTVLLSYCDGASHSGYKKDPVQYKGQKIYFRGQRIVKAHFNSLEKSIGLLTKVDDIVLSGSSAGGGGTYLWLNWLRQNAKATHIRGLIDSGIFLNQPNSQGAYVYEQKIKTILKITNVDTTPSCRQCAAAHWNQIYKCYFAENSYKFLQVPIFNVQSQYDSWSIPNILGITCLDGASLEKCSEAQREKIEDYHQKIKALIEKMNSQIKGSGAWASVCANHIYMLGKAFYSQNFKIPHGSVFTPAEAIKRWILNEPNESNHIHIDHGKWPENKPCSGVIENPIHLSKIVKGIMVRIKSQSEQKHEHEDIL